MANLNKIVDELSKLTVVEAADLSKQLEEKWGVTATIPVAASSSSRCSNQLKKKLNLQFFLLL